MLVEKYRVPKQLLVNRRLQRVVPLTIVCAVCCSPDLFCDFEEPALRTRSNVQCSAFVSVSAINTSCLIYSTFYKQVRSTGGPNITLRHPY